MTTSPSGVAPKSGTVQKISHNQIWDLLRSVAEHIRYDEQAILEDFDLDDPSDIDWARNIVASVRKAAAFIDQQLLLQMREHLGQRGFVRFGPTVYRSGTDSTWKIRREHENEFWQWVTADRRLARELFNPNQARTTGLKALAAAMHDGGWANPETGEVGWEAFQDYFLDVTDKGPVVNVLPADRAPQFIQNSPSGEVVAR